MAGRSSRRQGGGNDRIQALVQAKLGEGLQYEALQLYRGVVSRKSARGDHDGAITIAEQGIGVLLTANGKGAGAVGTGEEGCYADSATELGNVLVGILTDNELACTEERLGVIKRVNTKYEDAKRKQILAEEDRRAAALNADVSTKIENGQREGAEPARGTHSIGTLQARFLKLAVEWTAARGRRVSGDPGLCALLGRCLWNEGDRERGTKYLVFGERPQELCDLLVQDVPAGQARDLAAAKGVLNFASRSSLRDANALLDAYKSRQEGGSDKQPPRLILFCGLVLKTCEYDAGPVFQKLLEMFRADLSVDNALFSSVERIALVYFNIRLRPPSMLDNIMGMFAGPPR